MMRRGFTLIEMMIAISLFTVVMIFLYQAMATVDKSNQFYGDKLKSIISEQKLTKTLYLDLSLSLANSGEVNSVNRNEDMLFLQTSHVVHDHIMPYVVYYVKEKHLYRIESAQKLTYPFDTNVNVIIDDLGPIHTFRIYKNSTHFLIDISSDGKEENLMKVRYLNAI